MEPESLYNLLQLPGRVNQAAGVTLSQGEKKKFLPPTSRKDPKLEELQKVLTEWINAKLLPEHIVVRSLEEDIFDGLILHHLFQKLTGVKLDVEEIALTAASQRRKLAVVLEAAGQSLQVEEPQAQWSVESIFNKDLLATLHLLVALAKCFQPDLSLPTNVKVEVIIMESTKSGLKSEMSVEQLTECGTDKDQPSKDVFDELFKLAPEKVNAVKEAIVNFVNQKLDRLGLSVQNLDTQLCGFGPGLLSTSGSSFLKMGAGIPTSENFCRWSHLTLADWTTGRLLPALEGILSHSQISCGNAQCLCPSDAPSSLPPWRRALLAAFQIPVVPARPPAAMEDSGPLPGMRQESLAWVGHAPPAPALCPWTRTATCPFPSQTEFFLGGFRPSYTPHFPTLVGARTAGICREALALPLLFHVQVLPCGSNLVSTITLGSTRQLGKASGRCINPLVQMRGQRPRQDMCLV
ncbi:gamma-parvin isoform X3 [Sagmatias obliquidens]|uniref:gamma-parvin isoform X3 n=1 Tax=Sagmatias obliquidens TaxID=3371155 RepID=UPI000F443F94|nr:gamma-parvin isoform X3 [Lagenorhynchus obliquidens]